MGFSDFLFLTFWTAIVPGFLLWAYSLALAAGRRSEAERRIASRTPSRPASDSATAGSATR